MYPYKNVDSGKRGHASGFVAAVMALGVLLVGCTNPFVADNALPGDTGGLTISGIYTGTSGASNAISYTVFGSVSLDDVEQYEVTVTDGPGGGGDQTAEVAADADGFAATVEFEDLVPGEWTVDVTGYDDAGAPIVRGSAPVIVERGEYTAVDVPVAPTTGEGDGDMTLDIEWPTQEAGDYPTTDVVTGFSYSIVGLDGQNDDRDSDGVVQLDDIDSEPAYSHEEGDGEHTLTIDKEGFDSGAYFVQVELTTDSHSPYGTAARYDEVWYVYDNLTTEHTVALTESDFSFGGGAGISVTLQTEEDLQQFFDGLDESGEEIASGAEFSISVDLEDSDGGSIDGASLTWRINTMDVDPEEDTLDIYELSGGEEELIGQLTGVDVTDSTLTFTPEHGVDEEGDIDTEVDFPAGVSLLVTLQVEHDDLFYSSSFNVEVTEPDD